MDMDEYVEHDIHNEDCEELEREQQKELEEFLYSQVHYASQIETEEHSREQQPESVTRFPEVTPGLIKVSRVPIQESADSNNFNANENGDCWDTDEPNIENDNNLTKRGRYYVDETTNIHCYNCQQRGHVAKDCPEEKKAPTCYLCGTLGHVRRECPNELCFNCMECGHIAKDCLEKRKKHFKLLKCRRCNQQGHAQPTCPESWRQYHCTIEEGDIVKPKNGKQRNRHRFCYNCASKSHFGEDCADERFSYRAVYSQFIVNYDRCTEKTPIVKTKSKEKEKSTEFTEGESESINKKADQSNAAEEVRVKEKETKISKTNEKEKVECKRTSKEKRASEKSKIKEVDLECDDIVDQKSSKKLKTKLKTNSTKPKPSENDETKDTISGNDAINDKNTQVEKGKLKHKVTERAKRIMKNLWVTDEDIHSKSESISEKFSVKDNLGIEDQHEVDSANTVEKKSKRVVAAVKRKLDRILSKHTETPHKKKKENETSVETSPESLPPESRAKSCHATAREKPSPSSPYITRDCRDSGRENSLALSERFTFLEGLKKKQQPNSDLRQIISSRQELTTQKSHAEEKTPKKNQMDLDHKTLKDVSVILVDSDNDSDDNDVERRMLLNTPCPNPDVNLVYLSSGSEDENDGEAAVSSHRDDMQSGSVKQSSGIVHYPDLTKYNPMQIYEKDLIRYNIITGPRTLPKPKNNLDAYSQRERRIVLTKKQRRELRKTINKKQSLIINKKLPYKELFAERRKHKKVLDEIKRTETNRMLERVKNASPQVVTKREAQLALKQKRKVEKRRVEKRQVDKGARSSTLYHNFLQGLG